MIKNLLAFLLIFVFATSVWAKLPSNWQEIIDSSKYVKAPTIEQVNQKWMEASGGPQTFFVGDRFVFLFDPSGRPVVVFDLALDQVTTKDMILGAMGIGRFSLRDIFHKYKAAKERPKDMLKNDGEVKPESELAYDAQDEANYQDFYDHIDGAEKDTLPAPNENDVVRGYKEFANLEFNDAWIANHGSVQIKSGKGSRKGFLPASFTLGDLFTTEKQQKGFLAFAEKFSRIIYRSPIPYANSNQFLSQFRMDWSDQTKEFTMVFSPDKGIKPPKLPGWVINYTNPLDLLAYKFSLRDLSSNSQYAEIFLGKIGVILGIMLDRVTNNLESQMDAHENQLGALLESALRGEYQIDIPMNQLRAFVDLTVTMVYLNKMLNTDDITNGPKKRRQVFADEEKYRKQNLDWLKKKGYDIQVWTDGRFATVCKKGKRKGIFSLVIGREWITHHPSVHYYDSAPWYKSASRIGLELFTDAVRYIMPNSQVISQWLTNFIRIPFQFYLPTHFWDILFRDRAYVETAYEGHALGLINETLAGRFKEIPGYSNDDVMKVQKAFYNQRQNTFDVSLKNEKAHIAMNWKLVQDWLNGKQDLVLTTDLN